MLITTRQRQLWLVALFMLVVMLVAVACSKNDTGLSAGPTTEGQVPPENDQGIITADQWEAVHPDIYASYINNSVNDQNPSYLDSYPFLLTLYSGSGFALDYREARGHSYSLLDVNESQRPHARANCLSCKTPEMTVIINNQGRFAYEKSFDEVYDRSSENVSCYSCHGNTDGSLVLVSPFFSTALGDDTSQTDQGNAVCGQCHVEYYFDPQTGAVVLPWQGLGQMTPDQVLAYYNQLGFYDYTNTISGAQMIKIQHPEFETVNGQGNRMALMGGLSCPDCHMGESANAKGESYPSHNFTSPLHNPDLVEASCNVGGYCHTDLERDVLEIQAEILERETEIGLKIADLHEKIALAESLGTMTEDELDELRLIVRTAQFYWDFCFAENSTGAHNSALTNYLLDKALEYTDGGLARVRTD
ncbi:MAG: ammonia-forming cytochrome c nitrite reductase subunit c552 [Coriobacteriia bacterium]|nr:ammonia-forming cytochrome c nitrite reductase subunit c552 [Coriobacteriia bacterium]